MPCWRLSWGGGFGTQWQSATLWMGGTAYDLNTLVDPSALAGGWRLTHASDINEHGWIVGTATQAGSNLNHAFLLTPVPEPGAASLLLLGGGLLAAARRLPQLRRPG